MKKNFQLQVTSKGIPVAIIFLLWVITINCRGQVNFTQTTDADFNKGVLNNAVVSGNSVYLQYAASDVGSWLTTTVLPQTLNGHKAVSWNDRYVYLIGGYNNLTYSNAVYVAAIQGGGITGWTALNSLPVALKDPAVVIGTNTIYVMGGRNATQIFNTIYTAAINTDGTIGAWQTSTVTLPATLWGHTAVYLKGYIYIAGGSASATEATALSTVYYTKVKADNSLSSFSTGISLAQARNKHSMVTYNGNLYILGGYDNSGTKANTVYIATPGLDGSTGTWSAGTPLPVALSNHSSVVTNGLIMVLAGATGSTLSNTVYYADADVGTLSWTTSPNVMYDFTRDGSAFQGNGLVFYTGGTNLSGTPILNCRYANLTLTSNYVNHGVFVSNPFYELGAERLINSLTFNTTFDPSFADCQVSYRSALSDGIWGDWTTLTPTSPITVNLTRQYLQYYVIQTGQTTYNSVFQDMTLTTPGTQLTGNLNAISTFIAALSPYWATSDISFTGGTHTFQAGATILFLPETGLTIGAANIICSGNSVDSVKFQYFTNEPGKWNGVYFNESSDAGVSSQFYYTVIANAGFGANNANLSCYATSEPLLSHCTMRNADGNGISLNSAHISIQNSVISGNTENGLYLNNSNPTLVLSAISYNGGAGVYHTSTASVPNFSSSGTIIDHNLYAFRYPSPNFTFYQPSGSPTLTANTYNGIAITGGDVAGTNCRWNSITYPYFLLGTVRLAEYGSYVRLTIEPGNTIKSLPGVQIQVGVCSSYGGELYALGTVDSLITFTSSNGLAGGWDGIYFTDCSDNWGGHSQLDYCVIEKGNAYNYFSENTVQPDLINHSTIQNAVVDGARYSNSTGSITNCQFLNNGRYPLYNLNPEANPLHTGNTYTGNVINRIAMSGGTYSFDRTITNDGVPYYVLDNIVIALYASHSRLTVNPGVVLEFAAGKKLQLGETSSFGGDLYAQGTAGSPITFKAYNNTPGGWGGIYFIDYNDNWGGTSVLEYCTITQGASYNINCETSTQPSLNHCTISNSASHGIIEYQSSGSIQNCQFVNNNGYPIKYNDWTCNSFLKGNTYTGNTPNYIALSGGDYSDNRTLYNDGIPYHVLGDIRVVQYGYHSRITLKPGITLAFNPGIKLQLGLPSSFGGDLYAEGNADSVITFKPYNNSIGGWAGIYFNDYNDNWGGTSSLKYCVVEKGANYNMNCESSTQPSIEHCSFTQSTGNGLNINSSTLTIKNSTFNYNTGYGINIDGTGSATLGNTSAYTCNILNNYGAYDLYNNTSNDINARYNFWGSGDSAMITSRIYDKSDNTAKGRVYIGPFAQVPSLLTAATVMSGTVKYANTGANPMKNAAMVVKDFSGTTINSTTTNTSGIYVLPSMASGDYRMTITPSNVWGGVNSTDALAILNHFAQITPLTGMNLAAADVNYSHSVNGTDALLVMERYSEMITSFPAGDYLYHYDTVITNGSNVTSNINMLCFGDVNATYAPTKKSSESVGLVHEGSLIAESFTEFDFPVKLKTGMQVGAISLGFYYPDQYLEITGARLVNGKTGFSWTAIDGLFRMGWCDLSALNINNDDVVVILKMKAKDLSGLKSGISLDIYENCEFADATATPNEWAITAIPTINTKLTGINPGNGLTGLLVYPNPVAENSVIAFSLEKQGNVRITLVDIVGNPLLTIASGDFSAGNHNVALQAPGLKPGMYLLKIEINNNCLINSKTIKIVVSD